jgi:hypothetical protein
MVQFLKIYTEQRDNGQEVTLKPKCLLACCYWVTYNCIWQLRKIKLGGKILIIVFVDYFSWKDERHNFLFVNNCLTLGSFKSAFFIAYFLLEISNFVAEGELATVFYLLEYDKFGNS